MSTVIGRCVLLVAALLQGCGGGGAGPEPTGTVTGTVRSANTDGPVGGALVSAGDSEATADAAGGFTLTDVPAGPSVRISSRQPGFLAYSASIAVVEGSNTHDITMTRQSLYETRDFALYLPPDVPAVRGVILGMGGYDTRGYATEVYDNPDPSVNESQRLNRQSFLGLAATHGLAVMGTVPLRDAPVSDELVLAGLDSVATLSGHPEIAQAPLLVWGISAGVPETYGLALRHPDRVVGFMALIGVTPSGVRSAATQRVPGYVVLAERDNVVDNGALTRFFEGNRAEGALWSLAVEPGATHQATSFTARTLMMTWANTVLALRLPAGTPGETVELQAIEEASGWLGDRVTFEISPYADYLSDRLEASWLPSQTTAQAWRGFVNPGGVVD